MKLFDSGRAVPALRWWQRLLRLRTAAAPALPVGDERIHFAPF